MVRLNMVEELLFCDGREMMVFCFGDERELWAGGWILPW
jgi:hypothetical protein